MADFSNVLSNYSEYGSQAKGYILQENEIAFNCNICAFVEVDLNPEDLEDLKQ